MIIKRLEDIKIMKSFQETIPKKHKMDECLRNWQKYGCQDRYIVVNSSGYLIDGYVQYLVLKENNINEAEVVFSDKKKRIYRRKPHLNYGVTTYVYGKHKANGKEYVWRMPSEWKRKGMADKVAPGIDVIAYTRYGFKVIKVTRIETRHTCPINMPVYKLLNIAGVENENLQHM